MAGGLNRLFARWMARSAFGALVMFVSASASEAQWFPPLGAAPPGEIAARLRAQGFVLTGPLYRRNSIYVVDVSAGREGRERLIIDAWSGEILQRFVTHRGRWRPEFGREFGGPPGVFGPPPASEFYGAGPGGAPEEPARAKPKPRSAETNRQPAHATPAQPENGQTGGTPAPATAGSTPPSSASSAPATANSAPPSAVPPPPATAETANPPPPTPSAPATVSAAEPERPASAAPAAESNSSAAPAPPSASGQEAPKEAATAAAKPDAEKPKTDSAAQPAAPSASPASSASTAEKPAPPQAAAAPQTASETAKSGKPKGSETAQAEPAGAAPATAAKPVAAPAAKSGRKSRVNDIPVMPLD